VDSILHAVRRRQRTLTRAVLALFCLAWLQAAALPCVMAHEASDAPASHDCPYCPASDVPAPSGDGEAGCAYPHQPQVDARADASLFLALPVMQVWQPVDVVEGARVVPAFVLSAPGPRIPLSVSYCRYLE
jgi:predicted metal-binding membrane protein